MKKSFLTLFPFMALFYGNVISQIAPTWTQDITSYPDSAYVFPVRTLTDANSNVYVLSTYQKSAAPNTINKIYLNKYNSSGAPVWNLVYDNNGSGHPRGFDMAIDTAGNCYIAGGLMDYPGFVPLLVKVSASGSVSWQRDSTSLITQGNYDQLILNNNQLYVKNNFGIALYDLNGNEKWSTQLPVGTMAVDHAGQVIASVFFGNPTSIMRLDTAGVVNFSDSSVNAVRIAVDADNSFYLLADIPSYELWKYDSTGNFQWKKNNFFPSPPFGDIGLEVITDYNKDVIIVGLNDSMYKYSPSGNLIWHKSMLGLDSYRISAKIAYNNFLAIAGSLQTPNGSNLGVTLFGLTGNPAWSGNYNSNNVQEFPVDMAIDASGIYVLEDSISNTLLAGFENPFFSSPIDYSLICVDSVWYDPANPNIINVTVFNGNINHLNYPSVQMVSPSGDTVGNPNNTVNYFAHLGNIYLTYTDTITDSTITNFSNYIFLISQGFGDTTVVIDWCITTGINEISSSKLKLYPNPAQDHLFIANDFTKKSRIEIFNSSGEIVYDQMIEPEAVHQVNISGLATGIYFVRLNDGNRIKTGKFIRQ